MNKPIIRIPQGYGKVKMELEAIKKEKKLKVDEKPIKKEIKKKPSRTYEFEMLKRKSIYDDYMIGMTVEDLMEKYKKSYSTIYRCLRMHTDLIGKKLPKHRRHNPKYLKCIECFKAGLKNKEIVKITGLSLSVVYKYQKNYQNSDK